MDLAFDGDQRGRDGFEEILDGVSRYVYKSSTETDTSHPNESAFRGRSSRTWSPSTGSIPRRSEDEAIRTKSVLQALEDVLKSVFDREAAAGKLASFTPGPSRFKHRQPLVNYYVFERSIHAYEDVLGRRTEPPPRISWPLIRRMTNSLIP